MVNDGQLAMSLASVTNTALTALSVAEIAMDVIANNMANVQTDGFKASRTLFTSGTPATYSHGAAPNGRSGGTNPIQVGTGVRLASVTPDFGQGSIVPSSDPLDLAIEGDGFFVLEGPSGEQLFTRNGDFHVNASNELVSSSGNRVLGYSVDANFQLVQSDLAPLQLPSANSAGNANLISIHATQDGRLQGRFSDGVTRDVGQVVVARFANPAGLEGRGENSYAPGSNSGLPVVTGPNETQITSGRELSNASVDQGLIDMMMVSMMYRSNLFVLRTADRLYDDLLNLRRR